MEQIIELINLIGNTSSRNEKESILKANINNEKFKELLFKVYNPYKVFGIGKKGFKKTNGENQFENIFDLLDYLEINNTGTDETKEKVSNFINNQEEKHQEIYKKMILKDLKIGVTAKTINKIWKGLIPTFDVMLAKKYWDFEHKVEGENFVITQKLDGIRCVCVVDGDGFINFFSRQGQPMLGLNEIREEIEKLNIFNVVFDGELLLKNDNNLSSDDLYRATVKEVNADKVKHNVEFHVFDTVFLLDFQKGKSKLKFGERKTGFTNIFNKFELNYIKNVEILYSGNDKSMIMKLLDEAIENNQEGVMVNLVNRKYECKRTDAILKVKKMSTVDLRIIGFEEGDGKNKGTLGATIVDYKGFEVKVGSGYSDYERGHIWNKKEELLGKIMEVQFFEESKNQKGGLSLRFPVFKRLRLDKDEISYN